MDGWRDPLQALEAYETWLGRQPLASWAASTMTAIFGMSESTAPRPHGHVGPA